MITSLYIKNVAIIQELNIDFLSGFSTLTGETGAGKSIIMDSIGILLGSRSFKGKIRNGETQAIIRAYFDNLNENVTNLLAQMGFECNDGIILQRICNIDGKSTVKLNGQTITQGMAKEIGSYLISIHGQNDNQKLMQKNEHIHILDLYADLGQLKQNYFETYSSFKECKKKLASLKSVALEKARLYDIYLFQAKEIDEVNPKIGEEETLLMEEKRLENIEKIEKHSQFTYHVLKGSEKSVSALLNKTASSVSHLSGIIGDADEITEKLINIQYEIDDIANSVRTWSDNDGENADKKLDKIGNKLNAIAKLKKKYGNSIEEIIAFRKSLQSTLDEMENSDELIEETQNQLIQIEKELFSKGNDLRKARKDAAIVLQDKIMSELSFLEMPKVRFIIDFNDLSEPNENGLDDVEFLIATNSGQNPMPMIKIASGGELSRIMLAIKSTLLDKDGASSVIFDEIDTGISGKTSRKVGIRLKHIAKYMQVICVTHSAQIASLADNHFLIYKIDTDGITHTCLQTLDKEQRIAEVSRILGGLNITESQISAAKEMIEEGMLL